MSWLRRHWKWFAGAACGAVAAVAPEPIQTALVGSCVTAFGVAAVDDGKRIAGIVRGLITGRRQEP